MLKIWTYCLALASPLILIPGQVFALAGPVAASDNVKARLLSEVLSVAPGQTFNVALELDIRDGWHTYWRNPGDSGQATKIVWTLPPGFRAGDIQWTTPHRFELPPLVNYGYAKQVLHLVPIGVPRDFVPGANLELHAKVSWLVCADVCIPENADLQLSIPTSAQPGAVDLQSASLFATARSELPIPAPASSAKLQGDQMILTLGKDWGATLDQITSLSFFPYDDGAIAYAAPQILNRSAGSIELEMKLGDQPPSNGHLRGLLVATEKMGNQTQSVPLEINAALAIPAGAAANLKAGPQFVPMHAAPAAADPATAKAAPTPTAAPAELGTWLLLAMLGGLVLNLMPCVFPVLSIKAIGLVEQAKKHPAAVRAKGLVFAAGVIGSLLALAGVLLALRAGGEQIGWGFQLQSPLFVTIMIYVLLAVGLNLSGVFEVGGSLAGIGDGLTQGDSYQAAFFTGVLTTLVATPCTAPFMATAVAAALTQPPVIALSIFAALGFGLALPYLLLSFAPWLRRLLPRPGAWMDTLKQVFAFPMYASVAWLLWVLAQQTAVFGLAAALAGAILIGLAAWAYQKSKHSGVTGRRAAVATALVALVIAVALPIQVARTAVSPLPASGANGAISGAADAEGWLAYDAARLAALNAAGKPVLVNFTASWCLTCLVNERNAFGDSAVQAVFRDKGVTLMKGDWTNRDPEITKALAAFGRAGVPLYVVYNAKPGVVEPQVLPQLLSAGVVREAFVALPRRDSP